MTGLRTIWGVSLERIKTEFGQSYLIILGSKPRNFWTMNCFFIENDILKPTKGKF
jgi:oxygen-independent coproporphyrinogen-3 oxidase